MFRSVLVPLDGSTFGEHVLPLALSIARRAGASLHLVRVHVPVTPYDESFLAVGPAVEAKARESEGAYLDVVADRLAKVATVSVTTSLLEGSIADAVYEHAVAKGSDLVLMTTHGRGALARFWLGSVADELLRRLPMPILLVRPQEGSPDLGGEAFIQHVLIPLDGSQLAEEILEPATALGSLMEADYLLLRVIDPLLPAGRDAEGFTVSGLDPSAHMKLQAEAEAYLEQVARRLRAQSMNVRVQVLFGNQAALTILDESRSQGIDVIALATHGRGGILRLFLGSVADKVVRGATTPVLVCRPRGN